MSAEDNKAVVRRFYDEVMGQGRIEILDEIMVEDFVDHGEALFDSLRGRETLRQGVASVHGILPGLHVELHDLKFRHTPPSADRNFPWWRLMTRQETQRFDADRRGATGLNTANADPGLGKASRIDPTSRRRPRAREVR